jgi:hypothetical protein
MTEIAAPPIVSNRRPVWVWVIFVFYVVSVGWGLALQCLMFLGLYTLPPEQQALVGDMSAAARLFAVASGILALVAATSLWLLRKVAFPLFSLVLVLGIGATVKHTLPGGMYNKMFAQGPIMTFVTVFSVTGGVLLSVAIWWYVLHLRRRGVLK